MHAIPHGGRLSGAAEISAPLGTRSTTAQLPLRQAWRVLSVPSVGPDLARWRDASCDRAKFALLPDGDGGEIRALNERTLGEGRTAVERAHQGGVSFGPPTVHTYVDPVRRIPMEPLMFVKVNARREHLDPLMHELRARGARMHELELQGRRVVLRAEARLAMLLGFEAAVLATSGQSADVHAWLARYEPTLPAGVGAARE